MIVQRPFDVLRAVERAADVGGEAGEAAQDRGGRLRCRARGPQLDHAAAAVEHAGPAVGRARDQLVGPAGHGGDDDAVASAGEWVGAEQHAAPPRVQHRLDQHGHVGVDETAAASLLGGSTDLGDGVEQRRLAPDVED